MEIRSAEKNVAAFADSFLGSVNKLCHALFSIRKLIGRGMVSAKGGTPPNGGWLHGIA